MKSPAENTPPLLPIHHLNIIFPTIPIALASVWCNSDVNSIYWAKSLHKLLKRDGQLSDSSVRKEHHLTEHIDYRKWISAEWIGARKSSKYSTFDFTTFEIWPSGLFWENICKPQYLFFLNLSNFCLVFVKWMF